MTWEAGGEFARRHDVSEDDIGNGISSLAATEPYLKDS